jgi:hypothetical protein
MNRCFPFDEPHHLGHRLVRGDGNPHGNGVGHEVALFNPTAFLLGQGPKHISQVLTEFRIEDFAAVVRDEDHMVLLRVPRQSRGLMLAVKTLYNIVH